MVGIIAPDRNQCRAVITGLEAVITGLDRDQRKDCCIPLDRDQRKAIFVALGRD
jgi:hypothetical protein